jgi:hypothetical protein
MNFFLPDSIATFNVQLTKECRRIKETLKHKVV